MQPVDVLGDEEGTRRQILEGTLRALGELGVTNLSMQGIANAAGVSRGTIYRYFRNLDDVLLAVAQFDQRRYDAGARRVVDNAAPGIEQLRALLEYSLKFFTYHPARWMVDNEPIMMLDYQTEQLPRMTEAMDRLLGDVLGKSSVVRSGQLRTGELADLIVRTLVSAYLFPGDDPKVPLDALLTLVAASIDT
jgi:AcrR family transcriptional regulator